VELASEKAAAVVVVLRGETRSQVTKALEDLTSPWDLGMFFGGGLTAAGKLARVPRAVAPRAKFADYIFKPGATHGKDSVFRSLGYGREHSAELAKLWESQAAAKYARGEYTLGKLDQHGQRINIEIQLPGIGEAAGKTSYLRSGWMVQPDGTIKLNTPFSGFTR
jgi:filamentous hemagglutinin